MLIAKRRGKACFVCAVADGRWLEGGAEGWVRAMCLQEVVAEQQLCRTLLDSGPPRGHPMAKGEASDGLRCEAPELREVGRRPLALQGQTMPSPVPDFCSLHQP